MKRGVWTGLAASLWLVACGNSIPVDAPAPEDLTGEAVTKISEIPPADPVGACWGHDTIPAVIETVTETELDQPELRDKTGAVVRPASYRSVSRQRMVHDRETAWIRTPCYDQLPPDTILTLQRALRARGYFLAELSGELDAATLEAIRRYQAGHGLDTQVLSLKAAQALGLVTTDLTK